MKLYDRRTKQYEEISQYGQGALGFLYGSIPGRVLLKLAVSPAVSGIYGWWNGRKSSAAKIPEFVRKNGIRREDFEDREYSSFNDFFTRKLCEGARRIDRNPDALISPADAKLLVYEADERERFWVKGRGYTLKELTGGRMELASYAGGICLVYRLCMDDYHRYCFVDDGELKAEYRIKGKLHTVSPLSESYKIYQENSRVVSILSTRHFGEVIHIEVGALLVGRIQNRQVQEFARGEEKGYFEPGGSTIIQIFQKRAVKVDEDILEQSRKQIETRVLFGERVGTKNAW
ncbi:MAG: phosphatidylserine decarboxylase [Lachnospiraceae bacterium]|nr:phosphatidylserine decarboxylase [Lachnospiraceae bacterium]